MRCPVQLIYTMHGAAEHSGFTFLWCWTDSKLSIRYGVLSHTSTLLVFSKLNYNLILNLKPIVVTFCRYCEKEILKCTSGFLRTLYQNNCLYSSCSVLNRKSIWARHRNSIFISSRLKLQSVKLRRELRMKA